LFSLSLSITASTSSAWPGAYIMFPMQTQTHRLV
jgi:hypothetical protein